MYAVVKTGGKQFRVEPGQTVKVERLPGEVGDEVILREILMVNDGETTEIGKPLLDGYWVKCRITEQGRSRKIIVFKYKRRKGYRKTQGHRQYFTALKVEEIGRGEIGENHPSEPETSVDVSSTESIKEDA